jgi:hypothetical protein
MAPELLQSNPSHSPPEYAFPEKQVVQQEVEQSTSLANLLDGLDI